MDLTISMLVPTRERPQMLRGFVNSVNEMTHNKKLIDIIFICDQEDGGTQSTVNSIINEYQGRIAMRLLTRPRSEALNEDYYNWAARQTTADLIWVLADDLQLVSPGWDDRVQIEVSNFFVKYPDRVICVSILDNTKPPSHLLPKFPCFPMFTKQCLPALGGWILHPKVLTWGADYVSYCLFEPLGRLLQLHDRTYINHISWHTKQVGVDHINQRIGEIFNRTKMIPHHNTDRIIAEEVPTIRGKLMDYARGNKT